MTTNALTDLIAFAAAHPWIVGGRLAVALVLLFGVICYRRLYLKSKRAAAENAELIDNLTEGVYRSSPDGHQISANRALVKLNGYRSEAELLAGVNDIAKEWYVDPKRRAEFQALLARDGKVEDFVSEIHRHKTRERIWISESARVVRHPKTGEVQRYEGSVREITDSIRRLEMEERFRKLTDMVPGGLFQLVRSPNGVFTAPYVSSGFCRTVGIEETDSVGDPLSYFENVHPDDRDGYLNSLRNSGLSLDAWTHEFRIVDRAGGERWLYVVAQPEQEQRTITWYGYISDITVRKRQELKIEEMAYVDPLTGLPNRRMLMDRMAEAVSDCDRHGHFAAALFVDLDHFKQLNDTHGHETGDLFLIEVAKRLQQIVRGGDTVSRIGGDEFVVLLRSIGTDEQSARENTLAVAEKLMQEHRKPYQIGKVAHSSSASLGAVVFDGGKTDIEQILKQADQAMYEAKSSGRDAIGTAFTSAREDEAATDEALTGDLTAAIRKREFSLNFEPQVNRSGKLIGAEGFLRWTHPEFGRIPTRRILPLAAKAGLSADLDLAIIEIAIETLAIWSRTRGLETIRLAVNAGASLLLDERSVDQIGSLMKQHRIRPGMLTIEFTEQVHRNASSDIAKRMETLKRLGIRFSLDDFGSGYSSITYLKQLKFDEVKIDGACVTNLEGSDDNTSLVRTILAMADTLGITAVAEHVEDDAQEAFLRAFGCDVFQGRHYGRAMDSVAFSAYATEKLGNRSRNSASSARNA